MAYPTVAELVAGSQSAELTGATPDQQEALRQLAIGAVERFTGQKFVSREGTLVVDGTGGAELALTERAEAITDIVVKGSSLDLSDVELAPDGDRIYFTALDPGYAVQAMRDAYYEGGVRDSRTFRSGAGTVVLTGTFGWTVVPPLVVQAIRVEMEEQAAADASPLAGIVASARRLGLKNISQGNLRAQVGDPSIISPRAAALLGDYLWLGRGGYLI